ncbi:MAG: hypothetical protein IJK77_10165 [Lachnospiraceae bacterium]|nr:hypothetical protein [Lachnospiraceae bacterium]
MIRLTFEQKEELGFNTVRSWLQPASPYGIARLKEEGFYGPEQQAELERELDNVAVLLAALSENEAAVLSLQQALSGLKEVRGTLAVCRERSLTEVELYELTAFCLRLRDCIKKAEALPGYEWLHGAGFIAPDPAIRILHPEDSSRISFYIEDARTPTLQAARSEKRALELRLRTEEANRPQLIAARQEAVLKEEEALNEIYRDISEALRPHLADLEHDAEAAGRLDAAIAKALLARRFSCSRPLVGGENLTLEDALHPLVAEALKARGRAFVPISAELSRGVTVITGANMGGKSIALKTVVLNTLLALSGCYVFCRRAAVPLFANLELINRDFSNAERGLSSFGGEILRFNEAVSRLGEGLSFIAMDEFARGTNTEEGEAIARAAVSFLSKQNAVTLLTTHYDNTAALAVRHYQVKGLKKLEELPEGTVSGTGTDRLRLIEQAMDYGLIEVEPGTKCPRDAIAISRLLGLPEEILKEAAK